jgi:Arc/MetJ-type ribon-helix-helix transcriptional regulator
MSRGKERVTVTVDAELVAAGNRAVRAGRAESLSGWVNQALVEHSEKERRLKAMAEAVAAYESEFGKISAAEMAAQKMADDRSARMVRGPSPRQARARPRRSRAG